MVRIWGVSGRELALIPAEVLDDVKSRGVEAMDVGGLGPQDLGFRGLGLEV